MTWTDVSAADWILFVALAAICAVNCAFVGKMIDLLVAHFRRLHDRIGALERKAASRESWDADEVRL